MRSEITAVVSHLGHALHASREGLPLLGSPLQHRSRFFAFTFKVSPKCVAQAHFRVWADAATNIKNVGNALVCLGILTPWILDFRKKSHGEDLSCSCFLLFITRLARLGK